MSAEGLRFYKEGLAKPTHDHGIPRNPNLPKEIKEALARDAVANKNFNKMPPSVKRTLYRWFLRAKQPATRTKRLNQIIDRMRQNNKNIF